MLPLPGTKFLSGVPLLPDVASWLYLVATLPFSILAQTNLPTIYSLPFSLFSKSVSIAVFLSVFKDVFNRLFTLFRRREVMAIAETQTGEQVTVSTTDVPELQEKSVNFSQFKSRRSQNP